MNVVAALLGFFVLRPVINSRLSSGSSSETEAQRVGLAT
jgi:hypothetical protein